MTSEEIIAVRMQLLDAGWNVVPSSPRDKKCYVVGWAKPEFEANQFYIDKWSRSHPAHTNTAAVGNWDYFGVDGDVLSDPELADRIHGLALTYLGPTPFIRIGRWPKRLLVYRKVGAIQSVSYKSAAGNNDGIEILSNGRQFTIHGWHCEADKMYRWVGGANPLEDRPCEAPPVRQRQIDHFIDAAREIMPFAVGRSGGGGTADAPRHVNADGLIDDGRENLLRDCVWQAAHEIHDTGDTLTARAIAGRAWELFDERAWNGDNKYSLGKQCTEKTRALARRLNDGRAELGGKLTATPTSNFAADTLNQDRNELRAVFERYAAALVSDSSEPEECEYDAVSGNGGRARGAERTRGPGQHRHGQNSDVH